MRIGSQDHSAAACKHFSCKLMDDCLMRWYINTAVFFCAGQAKHVVIFIDRSAYRTKRVMAVCQDIWDRELFQSWSSRCLDNADKCNVMACQLIELDLQLIHISRCIMILQNTICDRLLCSFLLCDCFSCFGCYRRLCLCIIRYDFCSVYQIGAAIMQFDHVLSSC